MCKAYNVEESYVPHRVDGKVAKKEKKGRKSNQDYVNIVWDFELRNCKDKKWVGCVSAI